MDAEQVFQYIREIEKERDEYKRKWGNLKLVVASRGAKIKILKEENKKLEECVKRAQGDTSIFTATAYETKLKKEIIQLKEELKAYEKDALNSGQMLLRQEEEIKNIGKVPK